jgi:hypothetical protein
MRIPSLARNRHGGAVAACPLSRDKRTWPGRGLTSENDPGRVKTFFILQKLHAAGRDPRRRDHLSLFWLYRVWSQSGRNLGLRRAT